jgi:two-component system cell cycle response regulator DivK
MWGTGKTVLLVEDNVLNVKLLSDILAADGFRVLHASDGCTAIDLARKDRPDIVLMDIQLPGNSGLEVARWFKDDPILTGIPVIAISAFIEQIRREDLRAAGVVATCAKPVLADNLMSALRAVA